MDIIFKQVLTLVIFVAIGCLLGKLKLVSAEQSKLLSQLLVYVFSPASALKTFCQSFTVEYLKNHYEIFTCSIIILIALIVVMHFVAKLFSKDTYQRNVFEYSLIVPNTGYVGYPLAVAILDATGCLNYMVFTLPVSIYIYTIAFAKLTKRGFSLKKLINPMIVATLIGMLVGITSIPVPAVVNNVIEVSSSCLGPISMIMAGIVISEFKLSKIVFKWKIYPMVLLRLLVIPFIIWLATSRVFSPSAVTVAVLCYALPCGLNTVVFPRLVDEDCKTGAGLALVSTILSCITLPIILKLVL